MDTVNPSQRKLIASIVLLRRDYTVKSRLKHVRVGNIMSWLSNIANKAEAFLEKLDHEAAQALQHGDDISQLANNFNPLTLQEAKLTSVRDARSIDDSSSYRDSNTTFKSQEDKYINSFGTDSNGTRNHSSKRQIDIRSIPEDTTDGHRNDPSVRVRNKPRVHRAPNPKLLLDTNVPKAEDIKASINRSLEEYNSQKQLERHQTGESLAQTYTDASSDQIFVTTDKPSATFRSRPPISSSSCDDATIVELELSNDQTTYSASSKFLKTKERRRANKLNELMKRFSRSEIGSNIMNQRVKSTFRQYQDSLVSHIQNLNHYSRVYPRLKYAIIAILALLQLLVVYVLFFYSSSSVTTSPIDISAQVKQQAEKVKTH